MNRNQNRMGKPHVYFLLCLMQQEPLANIKRNDVRNEISAMMVYIFR
jgi:uncharacterized protein YcgL (UPF0745 family)